MGEKFCVERLSDMSVFVLQERSRTEGRDCEDTQTLAGVPGTRGPVAYAGKVGVERKKKGYL